MEWLNSSQAARYCGYSTKYFLYHLVRGGLLYHPPVPWGRAIIGGGFGGSGWIVFC